MAWLYVQRNLTKGMALINAYMNLGGHFIILTVDLFCTLFETGVFRLVCMTTRRLKQLTRKPETRLQNPETPVQDS